MHTAIPRYAATTSQVLDWWIFGTGLCQHPLHPRSLRSIFRAATSNGSALGRGNSAIFSARDRTWVCHGLYENGLRKMDPHGLSMFIIFHNHFPKHFGDRLPNDPNPWPLRAPVQGVVHAVTPQEPKLSRVKRMVSCRLSWRLPPQSMERFMNIYATWDACGMRIET